MPRLTDGLEQIFSSLGVVGAGYKLYFYETSTTTPKSTYSDEALTTPNTNPVVLNAAGRPDTDIWGADPSTYRMLLGDADSTSISVLVSPIVDIDPIDNLDVNNIAGLTPIPTAYWGTTAGTSSNYTLNPALVNITAYDNTQTFYLDFHTACSASADIDINGLGALDLKKYKEDGTKTALEANDVLARRYPCINDGTDIVVLTPEIPVNIGATTTKKGYSYLPNQITISNGTDTDHDIDFTAGNFQFNDGSGQGVMTAKTGELDAAFGTGNGMLDTGTIAADSTYYLFAVYNPTTGDAKPLASLSSTSPTMTLPNADGYSILGERLGSIITDGSANILVSYLSTRTSFGQVSRFQTGAVATGTTTIPWDNTIPQITEGDEYMTIKHAPLSETSKLIIDVVVNVATNINTNGEMTTALFQDSTANALASVNHYSGVTNTPQNAKLTHHMTSGTISPTTFRVRIGASGANTTTFNGASGGGKGGGVLASSITITEIEA